MLLTPQIRRLIMNTTTNNPANLLQKCTNLRRLRELHAHLITTQHLILCDTPLYWTNLIRSYTRFNCPGYGVHVYLVMSRFGVLPDKYTLPIAIKAAGEACELKTVEQFHCVAIKSGLESDQYVESGFINVYAKMGDFGNAYKVFDESPERKLGAWNAVIAVLGQNGRSYNVLSKFIRMRRDGVEPDGVTMVSVISSCGEFCDLELARQLHKFVFQVKFRRNTDVLMFNSVIEIYWKCGRMDLANKVFSEMDQRNVSSWTSMIVGYANHGQVNEAMLYFHAMLEASIRPNHVTFLGVLGACVHGGMVDEGKYWFQVMKTVYGINPNLKHYGCMIDLLSRTGFLNEARNMVEEMPMKPSVVIWGCLLGACEKFDDVRIGEWVAENLLDLEPWNDGVYVVLSNIYANRHMWDDVERIREVMTRRSLAKCQGYSSVTSSQT